MPIIDRQITHSSAHSGRLRIRCTYFFSDGRESTLGPMYVANQLAADTKLIALEPEVLASIQNQDAEDSERNDLAIEDSAGESTLKQRAIQYLKRAMSEDDPFIAFSKLDRFNTFRTNQGWTVAQVKAQLNLTDDQWNKIITRYSYLQANEQALINYNLIVDGDTVRGE